MGKKDKFIDKSNSVKYHLLHRSQRDEAHALTYEVPSEFVLVPAVDIRNNNTSANGDINKTNSSKSKDHINELGFVNDGYDYSKHLKTIGNGHFISKTGQAGSALDFNLLKEESKVFEMPEDVLASAKSLERNYEAITINPELMDKDIRAALFDGFDEEGDFEELQDDFMLQVMTEPEEPDFDFDAHIAKLIARSEQTLGINDKLNDRFKVRFDCDADKHQEGEYGDDEDEDFEEFPDDFLDDDMLMMMGSSSSAGRSLRGVGVTDKSSTAAVQELSVEEREALELQFERTLEEYEDGEIGYLSDVEEEEIGGTIDIGEGDNDAMNEIFDKFLQEQKDNVYVEGVKTLKKGVRSSVTLTLVGDDATDSRGDDDEEVEVSIKEVDVAKEYEEQEKLQSEYREAVMQMIAESSIHDKEIETCQEYLQETRIDDEWDCETILSTYSTLDNHPTVIKDTNSKFKKYKSRYAKEMDAIEDRKSRGTGSIASIASSILGGGAGSVSSIAASLRRQNHSGGGGGGSVKGSHEQQPISTVVVIDKAHSATKLRQAASSPSSTPQPSKIVLAGRLNLPEGYGPGSLKPRKRDEKDRKGVTAGSTRGGSLEEIAEESSEENEDEKSVDGHEDDDDNDDDDEGDDKNTEYSSEQKQGKGRSSSRLKYETSVEKKARKSQVKEENRRKRLEKKELKTMFKVEGSKLTRSVASEQSTDHVSVFRY